jgi:ABC-type uncharacterized transport system permease subunit
MHWSCEISLADALLAFPVFVMMNLLSGSPTPLDSMPEILQTIMRGLPIPKPIITAMATAW